MKTSHKIDGKPASFVKLHSTVAGNYGEGKTRFKDSRGRKYEREPNGEIRRAG